MKTGLRQDLARKMAGSIRQTILAPVVLVAGAALMTMLVVGLNIYITLQREERSLQRLLALYNASRDLVEEIHAVQQYVNDLSRNRITGAPAKREQGFLVRSARVRVAIPNLMQQARGSEYELSVQELAVSLDTWMRDARQLARVPDHQHQLLALEVDARSVKSLAFAEELVEQSAERVTEAVDTANKQVTRSLIIGAALALFGFGLVTNMAWRMSEHLSRALKHVSKTLRRLSNLEGHEQKLSRHELSSMFEALDFLERSVRGKAQMEDQLKLEKQRAEDAAQTKARFLANMSHEIRTPINGVLGMAEMLEETDLTFEQRECAQTILKSSEALLTVINDILDFSKNEAGELQLMTVPFSFYDAVYDVTGLLAASFAGRDVELCINYPNTVPHWFEGDDGRIRQILMNLIGNAVKFTDEGHVAIDVGLEEGLLSVAVRDTGVGIPEDKLGHVFGAFQQADMQATRRFEGTGLGLAITRQLITHMGGEISVTSTEGVGSEFFVQIPLKALAQPSEAPEAPWSDISRLAGRRILIVDDMQETRDGLQRVLTNWNMDVLLCASAEEALALKDHDMASIAVAIIDEGLKEPSGVELVAQLRSKLPLGNMPAILYTSHQSGAELRESLAQNVLMLQKPARENSLASRLLEAIGHDRVKKREADSVVIENDALDGLRVLVAEDNKTNRLVLGKLLKTTGVDIVFCENGQEAVDQFQTGGADIILMDMAMPVMDGLEATIAIRSIEQLENRVVRPIIALTANAMPADREACEKAGMSDFLTKPVRKAELIATLNKWAVPEPSREVS